MLAALLLVPAAAVAFPGARDDVLEWLGLRDVEIRRVPAPPAGTRPELEADLGRTVTLAQARRDAGFAAAIPAALGPPDRVRVTGPADLADLRAARRACRRSTASTPG